MRVLVYRDVAAEHTSSSAADASWALHGKSKKVSMPGMTSTKCRNGISAFALQKRLYEGLEKDLPPKMNKERLEPVGMGPKR